MAKTLRAKETTEPVYMRLPTALAQRLKADARANVRTAATHAHFILAKYFDMLTPEEYHGTPPRHPKTPS